MLSNSTGIAKKIGHSLWNTVLHCFCRGLGDSESQKLLLCQPFLVASFPWELRVSCALVIYNCTRAWWEPWPTSISQKKRLGRLSLILAAAPRVISQGELRSTAPRKDGMHFHTIWFSQGTTICVSSAAWIIAVRGMVQVDKHFCHLKCTWNPSKYSNSSFFSILERQDTI